jgi:FAD/FMN-containing dehydrogenase/Fe-S oxidoreductase
MLLPVLAASSAPTLPPASDLARTLINRVRGEVRLSAHDRMLYATDASLYQVEPLAVIIPHDIDDALAALHACSELNLPVLPRGGGTSLAGQCTNRAVVIDVSPRCRALLGVDAAERLAGVEPGLTIDDCNDMLAPTGLFFAADPATARHASFGGCIGNNAAGSRSVLYGRTSESIVALDTVLGDGTRAWFGPSGFGPTQLPTGLSNFPPPPEHAVQQGKRITREVCEIVREFAPLIRQRFPKTIRRNAGYGLDMVLQQLDAGVQPSDVNLAPMLCGSEGTLALTLRAVVRLHERPKAKALAVLGFAELDHAIAAVTPLLATKPSAIELLDDLIVTLARANTEYAKYVELMPQPPSSQAGKPAATLKAVLYVEYFASSERELAERLEALRGVVRALPQSESCSMDVHTSAASMTNAWKLRKAGEPLLHGIPGSRKPITFVEDNAIPVANLSTFVKRLRALVEREGTTAAFYAHASVGVLHVRPLIDIHDDADRERMRRIAIATADLAQELGGVMSGEHGDGRIRGPLLERFYGPELMQAFLRVKRVFDPRNVLNPGNIVDVSGLDARPIESITTSLRVEPAPRRPASTPKGLNTFFDYSDQHGFDGAVEMCNGAGVCRKQQGGTMCPSYQATLDERHSTRGRGNALRLAITGQMPGGIDNAWSDEGTRQTLHLCLSCKACKTECPSNVDISRLKAEYTAQRYAREGTPLAARLMGNIRTLNRLGSIAPGVANAVNGLAPMRAAINAFLDIHPKRSLPKFSASLEALWSDGPATGVSPNPTTQPTVVLFGDCFTMYNESHIGLATKRVCEAFGYRVLLANAGCCGRAQLSLGVLDDAQSTIDATIARLAPFAADPAVAAILVVEPSCLSAIKDDWLQLKLASPLALRKQIASKAALPEQFLHSQWNAHPQAPKFAPPASPITLHGHCHQKALWGAASSSALLERIAPGKVRVLDSGCCGMAGSFGYTTDRFDLSQRIGELSLFPAVREAQRTQGESACIAAPGTSCRHQLHDALGVHAKHPIELVASWLAS